MSRRQPRFSGSASPTMLGYRQRWTERIKSQALDLILTRRKPPGCLVRKFGADTAGAPVFLVKFKILKNLGGDNCKDVISTFLDGSSRGWASLRCGVRVIHC